MIAESSSGAAKRLFHSLYCIAAHLTGFIIVLLPGTAAVYYRLNQKWLPGLSDIDLVIIISGQLDRNYKYRVLLRISRIYSILKRALPMLGEFTAFTPDQFSTFLQVISPSDAQRSYQQLASKFRHVGAEYVERNLRACRPECDPQILLQITVGRYIQIVLPSYIKAITCRDWISQARFSRLLSHLLTRIAKLAHSDQSLTANRSFAQATLALNQHCITRSSSESALLLERKSLFDQATIDTHRVRMRIISWKPHQITEQSSLLYLVDDDISTENFEQAIRSLNVAPAIVVPRSLFSFWLYSNPLQQDRFSKTACLLDNIEEDLLLPSFSIDIDRMFDRNFVELFEGINSFTPFEPEANTVARFNYKSAQIIELARLRRNNAANEPFLTATAHAAYGALDELAENIWKDLPTSSTRSYA
jgi:hypothetical protein